MDLKPTVRDAPGAIKPVLSCPEIEFRGVSLTFDDSKIAIKSLDLTVKAGQTYAFVGRSGSGKTTVANLLVRFFDPTNGQILIDGNDVRQISLRHLRSQISMVTQDTMLFDATVEENIAYGVKRVSREDVIEAAKAADAHEFIELLPEGYDTVVGSFGSTLSGGQRQRLSIARAFLKDAPVLLLDEATSALDPRSEQSIINSIAELRKGRTTLIITHRLGSITDADQIIVMKQGRVTEQGSHAELLAVEKEYYKLYNKELKEANNFV